MSTGPTAFAWTRGTGTIPPGTDVWYWIEWNSTLGVWEEQRPATLPEPKTRAMFFSGDDAAATDPVTTGNMQHGDAWWWAQGGGPV